MRRIRKGDLVEAIAGEDRRKRGKVVRIYLKQNRALVQGLNLVKRHLRQRRADQPGGIIEKEATINLSNLLLVCGNCNRGVKVGFKILEDGTKVRVCKKCGNQI
jgi:large subunit ribosomal protein L24